MPTNEKSPENMYGLKWANPSSVSSERRQNKIGYFDDALAFFASQKQKAFPRVKLLGASINGIQYILWNFDDCWFCCHAKKSG